MKPSLLRKTAAFCATYVSLSLVLRFGPTLHTTTALKRFKAPFIHQRHALQLELRLHFHLSFHSKDYIFGEGRLIHLTLEGKKRK